MKKQLLLNLTFLLFTIGVFAQNSGTFTGTLTDTNTSNTHSFTASGNGRYIFTGSYASTGNIDAVAYVGAEGNYNIGLGSSNLNFESTCVETGQVIGLTLHLSSSFDNNNTYTINYQFIPTTYSTDTEPNNTFAEATNTVENTNYEGWFNGPNPNSDEMDWYKFTSPKNGTLKITHTSGNEFITSHNLSIYNSNNLNQDIQTTIAGNGLTRTFTIENFNFNGQEFGILISSICESYQMSWTIDDNTLSIENYSLDNSIKLYPNPVLDNLKVTINNGLNIEKVEIIGITGKLIKETNFINNSISTLNLKSGIYFVKIYSDKGITTKKIIKSE